MAVRMLSADAGWTWLCETVLKIDAGVPLPSGVPRLRCEREYQSPCSFRGSAGGMRVFVLLPRRRRDMQVIYERCAAVDVGKDVIAVAVRLPGDGPDGRVTVRRMYKTFYGVLREAARWLMSEGVTHVAMEATGIYSMPVYHALLEHGELREGAGVQRRARQERARAEDRPGRRGVAGAAAGVRAAGGQLHPAGGDQGGPGRDPLPD